VRTFSFTGATETSTGGWRLQSSSGRGRPSPGRVRWPPGVSRGRVQGGPSQAGEEVGGHTESGSMPLDVVEQECRRVRGLGRQVGDGAYLQVPIGPSTTRSSPSRSHVSRNCLRSLNISSRSCRHRSWPLSPGLRRACRPPGSKRCACPGHLQGDDRRLPFPHLQKPGPDRIPHGGRVFHGLAQAPQARPMAA